MKRRIILLIAVMALFAAACGDDGSGETATTEGTATTEAAEGTEGDLLSAIEEEGVLTVSTDPAYPPQSSLNEDTNEYEGFDIDVATAIAEGIGVEVAWEAPAWETIIAGNWSGRWDLSVGSMTITPEREEVLHFSTPYYFTPAVVVVGADDDSISDITTDLDGQTIGVCGGCTYDSYLQGNLEIPGESFEFVIDDAEIITTDTDTTAIEQLVQGRVAAVMTSATVAQGAIDAGLAVKVVGDPLFYEPLAAAIDASASEDTETFVARVSEIIEGMHEDGSLSELSTQWFGLDLTTRTS
ncbi:MAG TPA: transporter substrate-binding domain-containing protein [Acidimicrobiia bacterium]|nr:transporter substrate-binding domain-containing protein [Acidimicrobiia bacterium]